MSNDISLKTQNAPLIIVYLIWSLCLYLTFLLGFNNFWQELISLFNKVNSVNSLAVAIAPLLSFILSGLLSSNFKAIIVFWRIKNPLPGSRAFTDIAPKDPRIDMGLLKSKVGSVPTEPGEQNKVWYGLYKQVERKISVDLAHKHFLLARDLAAISFLFIIITPWPLLFFSRNLVLSVIYTTVIIVEYVLFCVIGQNSAKQFVSNVLAEYCCK